MNLGEILAMPVTRYVLVGGGSYVLELAFLALLKGLGLGDVQAVALSFWFGAAASFLLQKLIAFRNADVRPRRVTAQIIQYALLLGFNYMFTVGFVALLSDSIGLLAARTIALVITTVWNFLVYRWLIFKA